MKIKSILLVGFLLLSTSFAGCGSTDLGEPTSRNYETMNGQFMSLGSVKINKVVTHLFETDDGDIYYAYSDRYDLDDEEYFNTRVEAYGVVMEYDDMEKSLFEVRRISEAAEVDEEDANVEDVDYKDTDLGVSFTYPDNWDLTALRDGIQLKAPVSKAETNEWDGEAEPESVTEELQPDYIIISNVGMVLTGDTDLQDALATEIKNYVSQNYDNFNGLTPEMSYVGKDSQFAVQYKTSNGESSYFVPRHGELFELSFFHPEEEDLDRLKNSNIFAGIVASFRFLPYGDDDAETTSDTSDSADAEVEVDDSGAQDGSSSTEDDSPTSWGAAPELPGISAYREFESTPYKFKISYPSSWYYSGGNGGYDFSDEPIEDDTEAVIRLDLNAKTTEGVTTSGSNVSVTVLVGDRYYTLTGPSEYKTLMSFMSSTIEVVESE